MSWFHRPSALSAATISTVAGSESPTSQIPIGKSNKNIKHPHPYPSSSSSPSCHPRSISSPPTATTDKHDSPSFEPVPPVSPPSIESVPDAALLLRKLNGRNCFARPKTPPQIQALSPAGLVPAVRSPSQVICPHHCISIR